MSAIVTLLRTCLVAPTAVLAMSPAACDRSAKGAGKQEVPPPSALAAPSAVGASVGTVRSASTARGSDQPLSFARDIAPVLEKTCAQADDCHGRVPAESIDMDLRPAAAYAALVGTPAQGRHGALRVAPGDVRASFVIAKLVGTLKSGEGKAMPLDPDTGAPAQPSPLPPDFVERVLKPWIEAGARND